MVEYPNHPQLAHVVAFNRAIRHEANVRDGAPRIAGHGFPQGHPCRGNFAWVPCIDKRPGQEDCLMMINWDEEHNHTYQCGCVGGVLANGTGMWSTPATLATTTCSIWPGSATSRGGRQANSALAIYCIGFRG
jgi:hypothetical protein